MRDYYELLGVEKNCSFMELKRAYYAKAKRCHPDKFGGSSEFHNNAFREIVEAFNCLSDPAKRAAYDEKLAAAYDVFFTPDPEIEEKYASCRVMDTDYDEILEELIVGNTLPEDATLMTLMLDLERTRVFMMWREARNYYDEGRFKTARMVFEDLVSIAPENILYRVYLARSHAALKEYRKAVSQYRIAISAGTRRDPPQMLFKIRKELEITLQRKNPFLSRIFSLFSQEQGEFIEPSDEAMIRATCRSMEKLMAGREQKRDRRLLK